jgi:hypothetical protein
MQSSLDNNITKTIASANTSAYNYVRFLPSRPGRTLCVLLRDQLWKIQLPHSSPHIHVSAGHEGSSGPEFICEVENNDRTDSLKVSRHPYIVNVLGELVCRPLLPPFKRREVELVDQVAVESGLAFINKRITAIYSHRGVVMRD